LDNRASALRKSPFAFYHQTNPKAVVGSGPDMRTVTFPPMLRRNQFADDQRAERAHAKATVELITA
jgi:hypothetical protein